MGKGFNPKGTWRPQGRGFNIGVIQHEGTVVHFTGQVAWDENREIVGAGDLAAQAAEAMRNLGKVLAHAGASPADVVRIRTYVVDHSPDKLQPVGAAIAEFFGDVTPPANTWLGVQSLALPEFLVEIEATAVID